MATSFAKKRGECYPSCISLWICYIGLGYGPTGARNRRKRGMIRGEGVIIARQVKHGIIPSIDFYYETQKKIFVHIL